MTNKFLFPFLDKQIINACHTIQGTMMTISLPTSTQSHIPAHISNKAAIDKRIMTKQVAVSINTEILLRVGQQESNVSDEVLVPDGGCWLVAAEEGLAWARKVVTPSLLAA